jgi:hypothetical protein
MSSVSTASSYWLDLFTGKTWGEFLEADGAVSGFRRSRWKTVQRIRPGDELLCYLTGVSRFIGLLRVVSEPFLDTTPIWSDEEFPCRLKVDVEVALEPETAVPVRLLSDRLSVFQNLQNPRAWTGHFRGSPARWKTDDGDAVKQALLDARQNPVSRPVDPSKLRQRPRAEHTPIGPVTIPEPEVEFLPPPEDGYPAPTVHTEMQYLLLQLGSQMGFEVWVAQNDRGKAFGSHSFEDVPGLQSELKIPFDYATNRTVRLIDVLWLRGTNVIAAFEIESTTSIYSGLLRMADLITMHPNLNIPLYIVAPDDRREKVLTEVNRPTFSHLIPPLATMCRLITFSSLREHMERASEFVRYLRPEFLEELSETCEVEER